MFRMCTAEHIGKGIAFVRHDDAMLIEAATMSDISVSLEHKILCCLPSGACWPLNACRSACQQAHKTRRTFMYDCTCLLELGDRAQTSCSRMHWVAASLLYGFHGSPREPFCALVASSAASFWSLP